MRPGALNTRVPLEWLHSSLRSSTSGHTQCCLHAIGGQPPVQEWTVTQGQIWPTAPFKNTILLQHGPSAWCTVIYGNFHITDVELSGDSRAEWLTVYNHFLLTLHGFLNSCPLYPILCLPVSAFQSQWQGMPPLIQSFPPTQIQIPTLIQCVIKHLSQINRIVEENGLVTKIISNRTLFHEFLSLAARGTGDTVTMPKCARVINNAGAHSLLWEIRG